MTRSCLLLLLVMVALLSNKQTMAETSLSSAPKKKRLTMDTIYPGLKEMEYAVRGKVVIAADQIQDNLVQNKKKQRGGQSDYPFDHIVYTNIGNPHSVGQKPLTWPRQVMALVDLPNHVGVDHVAVTKLFPVDAIARAKEIKQQLGGHGSGAYSHSKGVKAFREQVASFIEKRDGNVCKSNPENIFLTNGASAAIAMILNALISHDKVGIMCPIPQYPLYSATIDLLGGQRVGYYLKEDEGWALDVAELERAYQEATEKGIDVRALVVINPGNPSGSVLTRENLHHVVQFAAKHNLVIMADEVYQENVYDDNAEFISCKKAAYEMGLLGNSNDKNSNYDDDDDAQIELVSFHSTSKGVFGECGRRGGYMELTGFDKKVKDELYKLASAFLCSSLNGQIMTSLMVQGLKPGDESYEQFEAEKRDIFESLKRRSVLVSQGLDAIEGFSCQRATGSMYCFPSVTMPPGVIRKAAEENVSPDTLYAVSLLKRTGICVVPASGFSQAPGRYGFRTTFLPSEDDMKLAVEKIKEHYQEFCQEYSEP